MACLRCWVRGRVQGVWFRASTREQAQRLALNGYAKNLADGRVEVLACGQADHVECLREWLRTGPPLADVEQVVCERVAQEPEQTGFSVR
ncbi:MAG: acylphosphatase [Gammaproteobacteria bacterium]|nr:acylphosphatase [Gammaproteobacteria bacterium]MCP5137345.1 acylphosphatase [Gammaproteobacteria bacterium]